MTGFVIEPNTRIGRYRVVRPLGRGGMAGVFEVEDPAGKLFALKVPIVDVNASGDVTRRFAREANALRLLDHVNVVAVVDVFVESGYLFLVMEKIEGPTLAQALQRPIGPLRALVIARQILDALSHVHARRIVHRDLKPANVLLVDMGGWERVKVIDFGIVKLLGDAAAAFGVTALPSTGLVVGSPAYMAPEQALGRQVDPRADLYSLGVILFEMLTGHLPFSLPDPTQLLELQVHAPVPALGEMIPAAWVTLELCALVEGALVKDPAHRFPSAESMTTALDDAFYSVDEVLSDLRGPT